MVELNDEERAVLVRQHIADLVRVPLWFLDNRDEAIAKLKRCLELMEGTARHRKQLLRPGG